MRSVGGLIREHSLICPSIVCSSDQDQRFPVLILDRGSYLFFPGGERQQKSVQYESSPDLLRHCCFNYEHIYSHLKQSLQCEQQKTALMVWMINQAAPHRIITWLFSLRKKTNSWQNTSTESFIVLVPNAPNETSLCINTHESPSAVTQDQTQILSVHIAYKVHSKNIRMKNINYNIAYKVIERKRWGSAEGGHFGSVWMTLLGLLDGNREVCVIFKGARWNLAWCQKQSKLTPPTSVSLMNAFWQQKYANVAKTAEVTPTVRGVHLHLYLHICLSPKHLVGDWLVCYALVHSLSAPKRVFLHVYRRQVASCHWFQTETKSV